jgi:hypothetical protein
MKKTTIEKNILIAKRIKGKGDTWCLTHDETIKYISLTETLEAYFQITQKPYEFRLAPFKGEIYVITTEDIAPTPTKKFNIYGDL